MIVLFGVIFKKKLGGQRKHSRKQRTLTFNIIERKVNNITIPVTILTKRRLELFNYKNKGKQNITKLNKTMSFQTSDDIRKH